MPYEVAIEGELRMSSPFNAGIKQAYEKPYGFVLASSICRQVHPILCIPIAVRVCLESSASCGTCIKSDFI